ncbi:MAG: hypothetical protein M1824_002317 [Vezdaea acicularis]|nr:MAG: hypothetical protein M1824_002317 [Vezdaea acicularis]
MSPASNLMDTELGGESTQYESIKTVDQPPASQTGQLGAKPAQKSEAQSQREAEKEEKGEQVAEKIRYGQTMSEHGFGGETTTNEGRAETGGGYGGTEAQAGLDLTEGKRSQMGYGDGSGVGA